MRRWICRLLGQHADPGGDGMVRCPRCGEWYDVTEQRDIALEAQTLNM